MDSRNFISDTTGLADMYFDDGNNGRADDIIEGGISWGIGEKAEQIGGDIFKAVT